MPVYQCVTAGIDLTDDQRERIATGITTVHHDETGAPEPFIRVAFTPLPLGLMYTAGKVEPSIVISGGIRYGRSEVVRRQIMRRLHELAVEVTGSPEDHVLIVVSDTPNGWAMEAGIMMPEPFPEAEAAWFQALADKLPERFADAARPATA
ncbi:tautomerase family protein [Mycobacterium yunnanensis]|uniref:Tautomerase family protein n=1 Tax=Mycobacterium yunnanensis TaxID=368477 RepID=A0A9X2YY63_9MYCO|nr:tautomerase family protein [Mycobacterium yunnanensis]MCV7420558.1 tautomerase family protein [Mycobacterium yunnanensis]